MAMLILASLSLALWLAVLLAPWGAWRCRESLEADAAAPADCADELTVLIPARNEAHVIARTLDALAAAAPGARVVLIDDESTDDTPAVARRCQVDNLVVVAGGPPPPGWTGKLWALQQGLALATTARVLLLDADIQLESGMLAPLQRRLDAGFAAASVCAQPRMDGPASGWLMPVFVYFFKLLYPFALANRTDSRVSAAAGGVILAEREALLAAGAFGGWRDAIIDDCTLAAQLRRAGYPCWIGLTHGARSLRRESLRDIARMVARTAFVQLRHSVALTLVASVVLILAFWVPLLALALPGGNATRAIGLCACLALLAAYLPTLAYYRRNPLAALLLPAAAGFFLLATWYSAARALAGTRSVWKGRRYQSRPT